MIKKEKKPKKKTKKIKMKNFLIIVSDIGYDIKESIENAELTGYDLVPKSSLTVLRQAKTAREALDFFLKHELFWDETIGEHIVNADEDVDWSKINILSDEVNVAVFEVKSEIASLFKKWERDKILEESEELRKEREALNEAKQKYELEQERKLYENLKKKFEK